MEMKQEHADYKRMAKVVEKLEKKGVTRRTIVERLCKISNSPNFINENMLSKYCCIVKNIPADVLNLFCREYQVNPDYVKGKSDRMFDEAAIKHSSFVELVDDWQILEYEGKERFLHLYLNKNFYDYLLEIGHSEILQENGMLSGDEEETKIREKYNNSKEDIAEYVLLPRNRFIEIIEAHEESIKSFEEVINTHLYVNYLNDKNAIRSPKHK